MKKIKILLLAGMLCLSVTACKSEENSGEDRAVQEESGEDKNNSDESAVNIKVPSQEDEGEETKPQAEGEYYTLYTEDRQKSVQVKSPAGYSPLEYSTETWLDFGVSGEGGQEDSQLIMILLNKSMEEAAEMMKQEVQYTSSANATGDIVIEESQTRTEGERQISYFCYSYMTDKIKTEGCRVWTLLNNGSVFACTIENRGTDTESPDIENMISDIVTGIEE